MNPFELKGPEFLAFYFVILLAAVAATLLWRHRLVSGIAPQGMSISPLEWGYLCRGPQNAAAAVVASLKKKGLIEYQPGGVGLSPTNVAVETPATWEKAIFSMIKKGELRSTEDIAEYISTHKLILLKSLFTAKLALTDTDRSNYQHVAPLFVWAVVLIGAIKIVIGIQRGRPVGFLFLLLSVASVVAIILSRRSRAVSNEARQWVEGKCVEMSPASVAVSPERLSADDVAMLGALQGFMELYTSSLYFTRDPTQDWVIMPKPVYKPQSGWGSSDGSTCGSSSSCGSSSCSSGCGGGGCGGCGGGD